MEQEDYSEDDDPAELENFLEEGDANPEESVLQESDVESEAHESEAFLTGWRAKQKTAGVRKGRGFQGQPSMLERSKAAAVSWGHTGDHCEDPHVKNKQCAAC